MKTIKDWIIAHKLLSIIIAAVVMVGIATAIVLPIVLKHEHTFATEWTYDENNHWHACTGKNCDEVKDQELHSYENAYDEACKVCGATRALRYQAKDKAEWNAAFDFEDMAHIHLTVTFGDTYGELIRSGNVMKMLTYEIGESGKSIVAERFYVKDGEAYYLVEWLGDSVYDRESLDKDDYEAILKELQYLAIGELKYADFNYDEETHQYSNGDGTSVHTLIFVGEVISKIEAVVKGLNSYEPDMIVTTTVTFEENAITLPVSHAFASTLSFDNENHWYACTDEGCDARYGKEAHDLFTKKDGEKQLVKCRDCGYEIDISEMTVADAATWEKALTFADGGYQVVLKKNGAIIEDRRYVQNGSISVFYRNLLMGEVYNETYDTVEVSATGFDYYIYEKNASGVWERRSLNEDYASGEEAMTDAFEANKLTNCWLENITTEAAFATFTFSEEDLMYHTETSYTLGGTVFADAVVTTHITLQFKNGLLTYAEFTDGNYTYTVEVVNDPNAVQINVPDTGDIQFTHSMSKADIIAKLGEVKNFTYDEYYNGVLTYTTYVGTDYWCYSTFSAGVETDRYLDFVENGRYYEISYHNNDVGGSSIDITDFTGYDIDFSCVYGTQYEIDYLMYYINDDRYTVETENGDLKVTYTEYDGTTDVVICRNFNATSMPAIPEKFKDYKTMTANELAVEYTLESDGTYSVEYVHSMIKSYEVPATYNGKAVTKFSCQPDSNLTTLTLPKSMTALYSGFYRYEEDKELHIIYKGTKAEWEAIENSAVWSKTEGVRITCSDGDYVVSAGE